MKTVKEVFDFLEESKTLGADRKEVDKAFADLKKRRNHCIASALQMGACEMIYENNPYRDDSSQSRYGTRK